MTKRSIVLRGSPVYNEEGRATETIKPGYLVSGVSALALQDGTDKVPFAIAVERQELGQGIDNARQGSGTATAFYASGDTVKVAVGAPGMIFTAFIASGQDIDEDELLQCVGNGLLGTSAADAGAIARSLEDLGGVVAANTACRVQVI